MEKCPVIIRLQLGWESFQLGAVAFQARSLAALERTRGLQDDAFLRIARQRGARVSYWPSAFSMRLATFTPLRPLTYFEIPR